MKGKNLSSHILASKKKGEKRYVKVYFVLPEEVQEKLCMLADEVGDANQVVIRALNEMFENVFEIPSESSTPSKAEERVGGTEEIKEAIKQLEQKITGIEVHRRSSSSSRTSGAVNEPEIGEIKESETSAPQDRPNLDGMLDDIVVNVKEKEEE